MFVKNTMSPIHIQETAEDTDQHFEQYNPNICLDMFEKYPEEKYDLNFGG